MVQLRASGFFLIGLLQFWFVLVTGAVAQPEPEDREAYQEAVAAIQRGRLSEYEKIRSDLDTYPLAMYLDYFKLSRNVQQVRPAEARRFLDLSQDSPLPNRFLAVYLNGAGKNRRWEDFLAVMPDEPNAIELKCYYFRAKLDAGDTLVAWGGAQRLWVYGKSRPKECDPLFAAWLKAGELSDEVTWARMLKAFDARERSLLTYISRKSSEALQPWSDILLEVYRHPDRIQKHKLPSSNSYSVDIVTHALAYLAKYNPERALQSWEHYRGQMTFSDTQSKKVEYAIALQSLFAKTEANIPWLESALDRLAEDKLVEIRLRWALAEGEWDVVDITLPKLSEEKAQAGAWRYWRAMVDTELGRTEKANAALASLSQEREYYGFLAADKLGKTYSFNNKPLIFNSAEVDPLRQIPAVQRVGELVFHEDEDRANSEWYKVLEGNDAGTREQLGSLALQQGWHNMAISAAAKAEAWDRLDLRFPMPWQETFTRHATTQQVPSTELMAIARRESAFYPQANSPVGARGLMQLMPATGKEVASSLGKSHTKAALYEVDYNVLLGSAYYRQLLDRYDGNRVFALTAYNAGPHRVNRWRHKLADAVPVEVWIETIPYQETRNYVQAVLSYNVVFQHLNGDDRSILTPNELQAKY